MVVQPEHRRDEEAIRAAIIATIERFNAHDAKRAMRAYMPEADLVRGDVVKGRTEVEKRLAELFATRGRHATQEIPDIRLRFIADDVALAHVSVEMSGLVAPDGQAVPPHQELNLRVFVRDEGVWRVAAFHNTVVAGLGAARSGA
jgi:uncharacterized protein (TIGR02246 family)